MGRETSASAPSIRTATSGWSSGWPASACGMAGGR